MATRPVARVLLGTAGVAMCIAAFLRGNHLLGLWCGVIYVALTLGLLWLFTRSRTFMRAATLAALSLAAGFVMAWPGSINSGVQIFIDKQAVDRTARAELAAVFASDPAYRDLSVSSAHLKVVNVTVQGALGTRADLDRLRSQIVSECPALGECILHWEVTLCVRQESRWKILETFGVGDVLMV